MKTLLLVDGNALMHRAYHAIPDFRTRNGVATNAVYGFITMLLKTKDQFAATHIIVCFDRPEPTFRKEMLESYQAQRPHLEDSLSQQFPMAKDFLDAVGIHHYEKAGFEADDIIGTISRLAEEQKIKTLILTGDKDIMQLVDEYITVASPHKGLGELMLYDEKQSEIRLGVTPKQIPDLKGLMGDPSDNYKGVPGIGPKTAANLIKQFKTLENVYKNIDAIESNKVKELLIKHKKDAILSKQLATIIRDVDIDIDIESAHVTSYNENLKNFFIKMEFDSLLKKYFGVDKPKLENAKKEEKKKVDDNQMGLF